MRGILVLLTSLSLVSLAGCVGSDKEEANGDLPTPAPGDPREAIWAPIQALMADVPCETSAVGTGTSENLLDLTTITWAEGSGSASLDFRGDIMVASTNGMAIINISDPMDAEILAIYDELGGYGDVKISPDGMTAIGGSDTLIELVDIRDPERPVQVGRWDMKSAGRVDQGLMNAHMLYTAEIAGEQWIFVAANNNDGVWILKLVGPPEAREIEFVTSTLPIEGGPIGPHDMWVHFDEKLSTWLLYSADGYHGWTVFDMTDPSKPALAGGVVKPESGYTHTIQATWVGEKRIVATIAEVGFNILQIYDATNLMAPVLVGAWHLNAEAGTTPQPAAPQHEFNIANGTLYLAHYKNGFYVFDLAKIDMTVPLIGTKDIHPVAHYSVGEPGPTSLFSDIWSVDVIDGLLYASSMSKGILVVGYGCNRAGDENSFSTG